MIPSEQANRPQWTGQGFEIWFFVVVVPGEDRALWVRLTRFADPDNGQPGDARVWAALFEGDRVSAQTRAILPLEAMSCADEGFLLRVGEVEFGHGQSKGRCGGIAWDFEYDASDPLVERTPKLPGFVPVGTHATHPHSEAEVRGFVELEGRRIDLDGGLFTQMHIWGHERVEWLRWAWLPRFADAAPDTAAELTAVAPKVSGPNLVAFWAKIGEREFDNTGLAKAARASVSSRRPGVLHHVGGGVRSRLVLRAWAKPEAFAGWDYRRLGPGEVDLHVAQTNLARGELELYRRSGFGWIPEQRLRSTCGALEFHGPDDDEDFAFVAWDAKECRPRERPQKPAPATPEPPGPGEWIETPEPARIVALGLTYKAHAKETGHDPDPVIFAVERSAWARVGGEAPEELLRPSSRRLFEVLEGLDPDSPAALEAFGFMPAMLDYEVELGLLLREGLDDPAALTQLASGGRVGLVLANDLTARSVQILGEGQRDRLAYWGAAKSLPAFAPTGARTWVPERFDLDAWPKLELETRVNGELRQQASLELLLETPRQMLARVWKSLGPLPPGTLLLTGTPAGVAFTVPRWKRALGERLLDRVGKLRAAIAGFSETTDFLRPGDLVEVRGGYLGSFSHLVVSEPE